MTRALRIRARLTLAAIALLAAVGATRPASQTTGRPPGADYTGKAFKLVKIADDVYHATPTGALTVGCNGSIIINAADVLVVDSHITPAAAWALREELKAITPKPIRYVVNSHFHYDHAHGNQIYGPDVEIIGHEFTRAQLASGASKTGRSFTSSAGRLPEQIAQLKEKVAATPGEPERTKLRAQLAVMEQYGRATDAITPTPPNVTLTQTMTLFRGGREIRLLFLGRAHTGGDVVVYLPGERLVATGDLLGPTPSYLGDAYITEWIATLDKLKAVDFETVLPGHGDAFTGKAKIDHFQAYLRDFWAQAQRMHAAGVPAEEAAKRIDMRSQSANYAVITQPGVNVNGVLRAYELLDGKHP